MVNGGRTSCSSTDHGGGKWRANYGPQCGLPFAGLIPIIACPPSIVTDTSGPNSLGSNIRVCSRIHIRAHSRRSAEKPPPALRNSRTPRVALCRPELTVRSQRSCWAEPRSRKMGLHIRKRAAPSQRPELRSRSRSSTGAINHRQPNYPAQLIGGVRAGPVIMFVRRRMLGE